MTWSQPDVEPGDVILFMKQPGTQSTPAMVTRVDERTISGSYLVPGQKAIGLFDGARHVSDPSLKDYPAREGLWDYTPSTKRLHRLLKSRTDTDD